MGLGITSQGWGRVSRPQIQGEGNRALSLGTAGWCAWGGTTKGLSWVAHGGLGTRDPKTRLLQY